LASRYRAYIRVMEPMKSGRIHYHLLVALDSDIRTGFDFFAVRTRTIHPQTRLFGLSGLSGVRLRQNIALVALN
ncbi:hypothetical protein, partial [Klebsiella pneumoniae]|uniref:hypothetical protein n=1 Tax=Klebsiella pneumoniae TaxID=573 RepID=UPI0023813037